MSSDGTESDFYEIQCSNCLAKLKVRNAPTPGKKIICPKCKESFVVGEQEALPSKPAPKKQAPPPIEDDEEELEETRKPKKKKKKQSGSGPGLAIGLSVGGLILLGAMGYGVYFLRANGFLGRIQVRVNESVIQGLITNLEELASVLESVKDESSAQTAAPRIVTISGKLLELGNVVRKMTIVTVEDERLKKKYEEKIGAAHVRFGTARKNAGVKGGRDPTFREAIKKMELLHYGD